MSCAFYLPDYSAELVSTDLDPRQRIDCPQRPIRNAVHRRMQARRLPAADCISAQECENAGRDPQS